MFIPRVQNRGSLVQQKQLFSYFLIFLVPLSNPAKLTEKKKKVNSHF